MSNDPIYLLRLITDIFTATVLLTLSIYHVLIYFGRKKYELEQYNLYFSFFLGSIILYVFFDDIIPSIFTGLKIQKIISPFFLTFSAVLIIVSAITFAIMIIKIPKKVEKIFYIELIIGLICLAITLISNQISRDFFQKYIGYYTRTIFLIIGIVNLIIISYWAVKNKTYKDKNIFMMLLYILVVIIYIALNKLIEKFYSSMILFNNYIFIGLLSFVFSYLLSVKFNKEFNELVELKQNLEKKVKKRTKELQDAKEEIERISNLKSIFFTNISHELRTPLTLILGPLESIISGEYGKNLSNNNYTFKSILNNSHRLLKLINNLLDFSKIEAGRMEVKKQKTDIIRLLKHYMSFIKSAATLKKINLNFINNTNDCIAWIDRDLFEKIMFNLLSNALKFTKQDGKIDIILKKTKSKFYISVKDNGIGIPKDKLRIIFDRFSQINDVSGKNIDGTGIGLSFTKEVIELQKGRITVKSRYGEGAIFTFYIPLNADDSENIINEVGDFQNVKSYLLSEFYEDQEPEEKKDEIAVSDKKKNVLVVDDYKEMLIFIKNILKNEYNIITASNGKEGYKKALELLPDIIISDVMMPIMDGYELTRRIKSDKKLIGIPIILLTAKADITMMIEGLETGADDYLAKPFNSRELKARIKANLEMKVLRDKIKYQRDILEEKKDFLEELVKEKTKEIEIEKNIAINLREKAEKLLEDFLRVLAAAIESKDKYTGGHVERVGGYAREISRKLKYPKNIIRDIYLGAIVHDVGKIGIKDSILNKEGKLTEEEFKQIKLHTETGRNFLSKIEGLEIAATIAYSHQERWDGKGYPLGLKETEIPEPARIVTICDYWDAITSDRPYRKAMSLKDAKKLLKSECGKAFDPKIYDIFMNEKDKIYLKYITG